MDGYAVPDSDGPGVYPVANASVAGERSTFDLQPGQIVRITTGAPLPAGSTAVVMVEDTKLIETSEDQSQERLVEILIKSKPKMNVREIGSDVQIGQVIVEKGTCISSMGGEIGILASVGITAVHFVLVQGSCVS